MAVSVYGAQRVVESAHAGGCELVGSHTDTLVHAFGLYPAHRERDGRSDDWACVATLEGHENEVKAACWSPCGQFLATCGRDKTVWVWDRATSDADFECAAVLHGHSADVKSVCWCPRAPGPGSEAPLLLSCSYDDSLRVWREQPGGDDWDCVQILPGAATAAKEAAAQARKAAQGGGATPMDEDSLATVAADAAIQAATASGGHGGTVWEAAWKQDGSRVASVSDDKSIKFWRWAPSATGQLGLVPDGHTADAHERSVFCIHWHPAGDKLATGGGDNAIRVWRVPAAPTERDSAKPAATLICEARDAHSSDVNSVAWHPAGVYLASCSDDGDVKVWRC
jgi:cytosolic iron-sulfur protein assembly protein CIAO1